jgi:hypothetical protein
MVSQNRVMFLSFRNFFDSLRLPLLLLLLPLLLLLLASSCFFFFFFLLLRLQVNFKSLWAKSRARSVRADFTTIALAELHVYLVFLARIKLNSARTFASTAK